MVTADRRLVREGEEECFEKHERWMEAHLAPKIKLLIFASVAAVGSIAIGVFYFMTDTVVLRHEKQDREVYETIVHHGEDIRRIEAKLEKLETNVVTTMDVVSSKLDRNYEQIKSSKR